MKKLFVTLLAVASFSSMAFDACEIFQNLDGRYLTVQVDKQTQEETYFGYWDFKKNPRATMNYSYTLTRGRSLHFPFREVPDGAYSQMRSGRCVLVDNYRPGHVWEIKEVDGNIITIEDTLYSNTTNQIKLIPAKERAGECENILPDLALNNEVVARRYNFSSNSHRFEGVGSVSFQAGSRGRMDVAFALSNIFTKKYKLNYVNENGLCVFKLRNKTIFSLFKTKDKIQFSTFADLSKNFSEVDFYIKN